MPLAPARRAGLVDQAIEQLRVCVLSGEWPVNSRIPTELELVQVLGVGRNTVREAVRALAHSGIFEVRQGDGTYVRATSEVGGALRRLYGSELRQVLQVQHCLEIEGCRLAATARTDDDLVDLRAFLASRTSLASQETIVHGDTAFRLAVVNASHNSVLVELYRGLSEVVSASVAITGSAQRHRLISRAGLVDAIAERDVERAVREAGVFLDGLPGQDC
ncbi:FadR/GntR family transcriptional regulator [Mycolicibacterium chlorophenolicum]|uniref:FadR/GntR family transcriptional regulator n=1 Tax=Mycolicibacterium chlorophenolicum TaxID=37916 RepID=UPI000652C994|nr:GntR family transcriptional regulator [Mycolicibacterium chlorophenolicum]